MDKTYLISQSTSLALVIIISLIFTVLGLYHSKKFKGINNYLTANRDVGLFSLTTSLVASALGAWILFGPAAAATWGGIGAVIGYALGTAFPMIFLIFLGKKIRTEFPKGSSLIEFMRKKFGKSLFKLILLMTIFYMFIFLCAEVTAGCSFNQLYIRNRTLDYSINCAFGNINLHIIWWSKSVDFY